MNQLVLLAVALSVCGITTVRCKALWVVGLNDTIAVPTQTPLVVAQTPQGHPMVIYSTGDFNGALMGGLASVTASLATPAWVATPGTYLYITSLSVGQSSNHIYFVDCNPRPYMCKIRADTGGVLWRVVS